MSVTPIIMSVTPIIIEAYSDKSEADAWDKFYDEFQRTPGKKIWRSTPTCVSRAFIDAGIEQWRVRARVIVVDEIPDGMEEATCGEFYFTENMPCGGKRVICDKPGAGGWVAGYSEIIPSTTTDLQDAKYQARSDAVKQSVIIADART